jgi:hypothetical protein
MTLSWLAPWWLVLWWLVPWWLVLPVTAAVGGWRASWPGCAVRAVCAARAAAGRLAG